MHVAEACSRIRLALKARTGRVWTVKKEDYEKAQPPIIVHAKPRYRSRGKMTLEDRRELAEMLGLTTSQVPETGLVIAPPYEAWVTESENF